VLTDLFDSVNYSAKNEMVDLIIKNADFPQAQIRLISLFLFIIKVRNSSSSENVSRETIRGSNFEYSKMFESIKLSS